MGDAGAIATPHAMPDAVPLALLPGTLCDARLFAPMLDRLALHGRTVLHPLIAGERTADAAAERVLHQLPARAALLGFSLGGIVALAAARACPARIAGLALVNTAAGPATRHAERRQAVDAARRDGTAKLVRDTLLPTYAADAHADLILAMAGADVDRFADETEVALTRADQRPILATLHMPTLVIGGEDDPIHSSDVQRGLAAALPDTTLALIAGAGHFTPLDAPALLAAHVVTWLARVDEHARRAMENLT